MSSVTTPDSIYYLTTGTSDPASLISESATQAASIQAALLSRQGQNYRWANAAARTGQAGMLVGARGYQADNDTLYRYSAGGTWDVWERPRTTFVPAFTNFSWTGGSTTAYYSVSAGEVSVEVDIVVGTSPVVATVTMTVPINMPSVGKVANRSPINGAVTYYDTSTTTLYNGLPVFVSANTIGFFKQTTATNPSVWTTIAGTTPMSWAVGDELHLSITYPAA